MQCPVCKHPDFYEGVMGPSCANPNCGDGNEWVALDVCRACSIPAEGSRTGRTCTCGGDAVRYVPDYQTTLASRRIEAFDNACRYAKYTGGVARALSYVRALTKGEIGAVPLRGLDTVSSTIVAHVDGTPTIRPNYTAGSVYPDEFMIYVESFMDDREILAYGFNPTEALYLALHNNNQELAKKEDKIFVSLLRAGATNFGLSTQHTTDTARPRGFAHLMAKLLSQATNVACVVAGMGIHKELVHDENKMQVMFEGRMIYFTDTLAPMEFFALRGQNLVSIFERKYEVRHAVSYFASTQIVTYLCESMVLAQPQLIRHWEFV